MNGAFRTAIRSHFGNLPDVFLYFKGRVALHAACRAAGIGPDDEIVMSGYTCVVVPEAFICLGAKPVYVDIDPDTFNVRESDVIAAITPRTRMVIIQHTYGIPCRCGALAAECRKRGIILVEDSCHALGTTVDGIPAGLAGDAAFLSTQWNKPVSTGLGGILLVNSRELAAKVATDYENTIVPSRLEALELDVLRAIHSAVVGPRTYGWAQTGYRLLSRAGIVTGSSGNDELVGILPPDYFKRMSERQADAGAAAFRDIQTDMMHRTMLGDLYRQRLAPHGFAVVNAIEGTVFNRYPLRVSNKAELLEKGLRRGLEIGSWFETPLHPVPLSEHVRFGWSGCPESERAAAVTVNLPCNRRTTVAAADRIVDFIKRHAIPAV